MKACLIRKIVYRSSADKRPRWGFILVEREGLSLLLVPSRGDSQPHLLVLASENVAERVFEDVNQSRFPLEAEDMAGIGAKLSALGNGLTEDEIEQWLKDEGLW